MKTVILVITLLALAGLIVAQTAKPATSQPTKVTGDPTKTASGLEYWDIKVGTGAVAKADSTSKSITPAGSPTARSSTARSAPASHSSSCWAPARSSKAGTKVSPA